VMNYYDQFIDPKEFADNMTQANNSKIIVNAEEKSVPMLYSAFVWPPV
jgi:hypothetical protein